MAKLLASSGGELTLPKLLADDGGASALDSASANVGGGFAFDIKGKSQEDLDACILVDPAPGQGCRGMANACEGFVTFHCLFACVPGPAYRGMLAHVWAQAVLLGLLYVCWRHTL